MSRWYLDTSAALKLIIDEVESEALAGVIDEQAPELVACLLLETELRRTMHRHPALSQELASDVLDGVSLYEVPGSLFREAGLLPGAQLRSLDALHLTAAVRLSVDAVVTYDARMIDGARSLGLRTLSPT